MDQAKNTPGVSRVCAGAALTAALELAGHWAPWPRRLPRMLAYGYGVLAILAGAAVVLERPAWRRLGLVCVGAGAATALGYVADALLNRWALAQAGHDGRDR
jgi:hypothetical protein